MAKKFNQVYKLAKETAYSSESTSLVLMASMNSVVDFTPVLAPNGKVDAGATTAEYLIQRIKRIKAKDIANPNTGSTADALAALDTFSKVDWETIGTATGILRGVGVKTGINEQFDIDSLGEGHAKAVSDSVAVQAIERKEALLSEIITSASVKKDALAFSPSDTKIFDGINEEVNRIMLLSDEYKHMTDKQNIVVFMHPALADKVAKEVGVLFQSEAPVYKTGMTSKFSINGVPVIVEASLNKFAGQGAGTAGTAIGAVVMDAEAVAFKAANETVPVSVDLGLTKYNGTYFYNVQKVIDASRISTFDFDSALLTAKVSD